MKCYKNSQFLQDIGFQVDHHQNGIDLYYDHSSNSQQYTNSDEYMDMFENKFQFSLEKKAA